LGIFLGLCGIILIFTPTFQLHDLRSSSLWGTVAVVAMAISYAASIIMNRRLLSGEKKVDIYTNAFHQLLSSLIFLLIIALILEGPDNIFLAGASTEAIISCLYLGIFSTSIAWLIFYHLITIWGAVRTSTTTYVIPIMAIALDFFFFGEKPKLVTIIGMLIVFSAIPLIQFKKGLSNSKVIIPFFHPKTEKTGSSDQETVSQ